MLYHRCTGMCNLCKCKCKQEALQPLHKPLQIINICLMPNDAWMVMVKTFCLAVPIRSIPQAAVTTCESLDQF